MMFREFKNEILDSKDCKSKKNQKSDTQFIDWCLVTFVCVLLSMLSPWFRKYFIINYTVCIALKTLVVN